MTTKMKPSYASPGGRRLWIRARIGLFLVVVLACGYVSGLIPSLWTSAFPHTCAGGKPSLFAVDFEAFPARIGEQDNLCVGISDGQCERTAGDELVQGECRDGRMHGGFSVKSTKTKSTIWVGNYCNGLPCGEFHVSLDATHENVFHVEMMHIHGAATLWEKNAERWIEASGRYEQGKRIGRWVRRIEPSRALYLASVFDDNGFLRTTSFSCTNGNLKEVRGKDVFVFDAQGKSIEKSTVDGEPLSENACPLP